MAENLEKLSASTARRLFSNVYASEEDKETIQNASDETILSWQDEFINSGHALVTDGKVFGFASDGQGNDYVKSVISKKAVAIRKEREENIATRTVSTDGEDLETIAAKELNAELENRIRAAEESKLIDSPFELQSRNIRDLSEKKELGANYSGFSDTKERDSVWKKNKSFSITDFRKKISGVSFASKFYYRFSDSEWLDKKFSSGKYKTITEDLFFYSDDQITVPARTLGLNSEYRYANGFRVQTANQTKYGDGSLRLTFRVDEKYHLYDLFQDWISEIHDPSTGYLSFYDDYTTDFEVYQLPYDMLFFENIKGTEKRPFDEYLADHKANTYRFEFKKCYPISIGNLDFAHQSNSFTKVQVELYYSGVRYKQIGAKRNTVEA